jgi:hypothetical protein
MDLYVIGSLRAFVRRIGFRPLASSLGDNADTWFLVGGNEDVIVD